MPGSWKSFFFNHKSYGKQFIYVKNTTERVRVEVGGGYCDILCNGPASTLFGKTPDAGWTLTAWKLMGGKLWELDPGKEPGRKPTWKNNQ